jgi:hypothetical protein
MTKIFTPAAPTTTVTAFLYNYYDGAQYDVDANYAGEELLAEVREALAQCDVHEDAAEIKGLCKVMTLIIKDEAKAGRAALRMMKEFNTPKEYNDEESRVFGYQY